MGVAAAGAGQAEALRDGLGLRYVALAEPVAVVHLDRVDEVGDLALEAGVVDGAAAPAARRRMHPDHGGVIWHVAGAWCRLHVAERCEKIRVRREDDEVAVLRADLDAADEEDSLRCEQGLQRHVVAQVAVIGERNSSYAASHAALDVLLRGDRGAAGGGKGVRMQIDEHKGII